MLPRIPLAQSIDASVDFLVETCSDFTRAGSAAMGTLLDGFENLLMLPQPWLFILLLGLVCWWATRSIKLPAFSMLGFALLWNLGLWEPTMSTLALVLSATLLSVLLGVPCGILAAVVALGQADHHARAGCYADHARICISYTSHSFFRYRQGKRRGRNGGLFRAASHSPYLPGHHADSC